SRISENEKNSGARLDGELFFPAQLPVSAARPLDGKTKPGLPETAEGRKRTGLEDLPAEPAGDRRYRHRRRLPFLRIMEAIRPLDSGAACPSHYPRRPPDDGRHDRARVRPAPEPRFQRFSLLPISLGVCRPLRRPRAPSGARLYFRRHPSLHLRPSLSASGKGGEAETARLDKGLIDAPYPKRR